MTTQRFHIHFKSDPHPPTPVVNLWLATAINRHLFFILLVVCLFVYPFVKSILETSVWRWERLALAGRHFPVIRQQDKHSELTHRRTAASALNYLQSSCVIMRLYWDICIFSTSQPPRERFKQQGKSASRKKHCCRSIPQSRPIKNQLCGLIPQLIFTDRRSE